MTLLCHTQKAFFSHLLLLFNPRSPAKPAPGTPGGLLASYPGQPSLWDNRRCQGKPRQTFPKLGRLGRDPGRGRACAPSALACSQGSGEPGWSRWCSPGGPTSSGYPKSLGSGVVCPSRMLEAAAPHQLSAILLSLRMEVSKRVSRKRRVELGASHREEALNENPRLPLRSPQVTAAPWLGGEPRVVRLQGVGWPGAQVVGWLVLLGGPSACSSSDSGGTQASSWPHFRTLGGLSLIL